MADMEATRAVVEASETYDGRIFPTEKAEIDRPVRIRESATVKGSIYGGTVEGDPNASVQGSVMAAESAELDESHIGGELGSPGKIVATGSRIDGTVTGKRVRLIDCVVRGNVVGSEVILENCIVLGIATAERSLTVEDSLCYTVRGQGETRLDRTTLVLPQAIVDGTLELPTPVEVAALGEIEVEDDSEGRLPKMTSDDLYEQNGTTYLTLAPRILNLEKVTDRLEELETGVMSAVDDTSGDEGTDMSVDDVFDLLDISHDSAVDSDG
ncbi:hypothetical protein [Natrinema salinisoli]|uniref:hypothetical protein n=1 Tax=Natrinema salinisoli TaxID=2878535 RepID=UPI001CF05241|nr:hypothetical protein [Natrinema salinisoli]